MWRVGVRNRLETRRDDRTITWFELDTYVDVNFDNPFDRTDYSNLFNNIRFTPLPWVSFSVNSQVPAFDKGFTEVDTDRERSANGQSAIERCASLFERKSLFPGQQPVCCRWILPYRR